MKKIFNLALCLLLLTSLLCGCSADPETPPPPAEEKYEIPVFAVEPDITPVFQQGYLNVKDCGALGDGKTDDSAALTAAVATLIEQNGAGTLWFPAGTYYITGSLEIPSGIECVFEKGAELYIMAKANVVFNGTVTAGFYNVFSGTFEGLLDNKEVFPQWFGAAGDGKTNDSAAFTRALQHARDLAIPNTAGGYLLNTVVVPKMTRIHGYNGKAATIYGQADATCIFEFNDSSSQSVVYDLIFRMSDCEKGACFFFNSASVQRLTHIELYNIYTEGAYNVVLDAHIEDAVLSDIVVRDLLAINSRGIAFDTNNFWGFCFLRESVFDNSGVDEAFGEDAGNCPIVEIGDNAGFIIQNNLIIGSGNPNNIEEVGFMYNNNTATWMDNCEVRETGSHAFKINGGSHLYFSNVRAKHMFGDGMVVGTMQMQLSNLQVIGRKELAQQSESQIGVQLRNVTDSQINRVSVSDINGNGVFGVCQSSSITNLDVRNCSRIGLMEAGEKSVYAGVTVANCGNVNIQIMSTKVVMTNVTSDNKHYDSLTQPDNY